MVKHEGWGRLYGGLTPSLVGTAASQVRFLFSFLFELSFGCSSSWFYYCKTVYIYIYIYIFGCGTLQTKLVMLYWKVIGLLRHELVLEGVLRQDGDRIDRSIVISKAYDINVVPCTLWKNVQVLRSFSVTCYLHCPWLLVCLVACRPKRLLSITNHKFVIRLLLNVNPRCVAS